MIDSYSKPLYAVDILSSYAMSTEEEHSESTTGSPHVRDIVTQHIYIAQREICGVINHIHALFD